MHYEVPSMPSSLVAMSHAAPIFPLMCAAGFVVCMEALPSPAENWLVSPFIAHLPTLTSACTPAGQDGGVSGLYSVVHTRP